MVMGQAVGDVRLVVVVDVVAVAGVVVVVIHCRLLVLIVVHAGVHEGVPVSRIGEVVTVTRVFVRVRSVG